MNRRDWQDHLSTFETSGLSGSAYCAEHALVYHQFVYWRRKLRQDAAPGGFAAVTVTHAERCTTPRPLGIIEFPCGARLTIHDASLLGALGPVLQS